MLELDNYRINFCFQLFGMKTGTGIFLLVIILSLIQILHGQDLKRFRIGEYNVEDLVQLILEYLVHFL